MSGKRRLVVGLVIVDFPALVAVAILGRNHGYTHTYEAVSGWRAAHPWSYVPSVALLFALAIRWRKRRAAVG